MKDAQDTHESPQEASFAESMQADTRERRDFAEAFLREQSKQPSVEDLINSQHKQAIQIKQLNRSVNRLRRIVMLAGLVSIGALAAVGYSYVQSPPGLPVVNRTNSQDGGLVTEEPSFRDSMLDELIVDSQLQFKVRTDADRKYQLAIRELFRRANGIRRPRRGEGIEERAGLAEDYIKYMADLSAVIEEAAQEELSPEVSTALTNLALIAPKLRQLDWEFIDIETRNQIEQIERVVGAYDLRRPAGDMPR